MDYQGKVLVLCMATAAEWKHLSPDPTCHRLRRLCALHFLIQAMVDYHTLKACSWISLKQAVLPLENTLTPLTWNLVSPPAPSPPLATPRLTSARRAETDQDMHWATRRQHVGPSGRGQLAMEKWGPSRAPSSPFSLNPTPSLRGLRPN